MIFLGLIAVALAIGLGLRNVATAIHCSRIPLTENEARMVYREFQRASKRYPLRVRTSKPYEPSHDA